MTVRHTATLTLRLVVTVALITVSGCIKPPPPTWFSNTSTQCVGGQAEFTGDINFTRDTATAMARMELAEQFATQTAGAFVYTSHEGVIVDPETGEAVAATIREERTNVAMVTQVERVEMVGRTMYVLVCGEQMEVVEERPPRTAVEPEVVPLNEPAEVPAVDSPDDPQVDPEMDAALQPEATPEIEPVVPAETEHLSEEELERERQREDLLRRLEEDE